MTAIRSFSSQFGESATRSIDNDAPIGLRQELIDLAFHILSDVRGDNDARLYRVICQSLGAIASGQPYSGFRYAAGRTINDVEWPRVYDLICRLWADLKWDAQSEYRAGVNRLLAAYQVAWDLGEDGQLHRVLPAVASIQIEAAFRELSAPRFAAALSSFREGMQAYDDRPQRGRDVCKNIFDAVESVSKELFAMPSATFGNVLTEARKQQTFASETISTLQKLYDMANNRFRHGMTTPFTLKTAEVDYVLLSCIGGLVLFIRAIP
jgi:hypothetical protein